MKNNALFEIEEKRIPKKKPISIENWLTLCEKEEIIHFLSEYMPYANAPVRKGSSSKNGIYEVEVNENNKELLEKHGVKFENYTLDDLIPNWKYGKLESGYGRKIIFTFNISVKKQYMDEWYSLYA